MQLHETGHAAYPVWKGIQALNFALFDPKGIVPPPAGSTPPSAGSTTIKKV